MSALFFGTSPPPQNKTPQKRTCFFGIFLGHSPLNDFLFGISSHQKSGTLQEDDPCQLLRSFWDTRQRVVLGFFFRNTVSPQTWSSKLVLWDAFKQNPTKVMSRTLNPGDRNGKTRSQSSQTSPQKAPHMFAAQKGTKENLWHPRMSPFKPSHKEGTLIHPPLGACGLYGRQCLFLGSQKKKKKNKYGSCPGLTSTPVYQ